MAGCVNKMPQAYHSEKGYMHAHVVPPSLPTCSRPHLINGPIVDPWYSVTARSPGSTQPFQLVSSLLTLLARRLAFLHLNGFRKYGAVDFFLIPICFFSTGAQSLRKVRYVLDFAAPHNS